MQFENDGPREHRAMMKLFMHGFKSLRKSVLKKKQKRNLPQKRGVGVAVGAKGRAQKRLMLPRIVSLVLNNLVARPAS